MAYVNLLAKIEGEINKVVDEQQKQPRDINLATKKVKLLKLATDYINLEGQYKELAGLNGIY